MLAITDAQAVIAGVIAVFVLITLVALVRVVMRRESHWRKIRVGLFVERDHDHDSNSGQDPPSP